MTKIFDRQQVAYSVKFMYIFTPEFSTGINNPKKVRPIEDNLSAKARTICSIRNLDTKEVFIGQCDCSKKDKYNKRTGMYLAFERAIGKITDNKQKRLDLWVEYFNKFKDPGRERFLDKYFAGMVFIQ